MMVSKYNGVQFRKTVFLSPCSLTRGLAVEAAAARYGTTCERWVARRPSAWRHCAKLSRNFEQHWTKPENQPKTPAQRINTASSHPLGGCSEGPRLGSGERLGCAFAIKWTATIQDVSVGALFENQTVALSLWKSVCAHIATKSNSPFSCWKSIIPAAYENRSELKSVIPCRVHWEPGRNPNLGSLRHKVRSVFRFIESHAAITLRIYGELWWNEIKTSCREVVGSPFGFPERSCNHYPRSSRAVPRSLSGLMERRAAIAPQVYQGPGRYGSLPAPLRQRSSTPTCASVYPNPRELPPVAGTSLARRKTISPWSI